MDITKALGEAVMLILKVLAGEIATAIKTTIAGDMPGKSIEPAIYSVAEVAACLGVSKDTVYKKLLTDPEFPAQRVGRQYRIPAVEFEKWLKKRNDNEGGMN